MVTPLVYGLKNSDTHGFIDVHMTIHLLIGWFSHDQRSIQVQDSECLDRIASLLLYTFANWIPDSHDWVQFMSVVKTRGIGGTPSFHPHT